MATITPVAIFFADSHLDIGAWAKRPGLCGDSKHAFSFIVRDALAMDVTDIFAAGDLLNVKKPSPEVVEFCRQSMETLFKAGIGFNFIQGQHELSAGVPWLSAIHGWPAHLHKNCCTIADTRFHVIGLDWTPADLLDKALLDTQLLVRRLAQSSDDTVIVLGHQVWEEFMGHLCGCEGSVTQVPGNVLFTGDYHAQRELTAYKGRDGQPLRVISPGATNIRKIDEPGEHFYYILWGDGRWQPVAIPGRKKISALLLHEDDLTDFADYWEAQVNLARCHAEDNELPPELHTPLLHITYAEHLDSALSTVKDVVKNTAEIFWRMRRPEDVAVTVDREQRDRMIENGLAGCLPLLVPDDDPRFAPLLRLLTSRDPEGELVSMRQERGL